MNQESLFPEELIPSSYSELPSVKAKIIGLGGLVCHWWMA